MSVSWEHFNITRFLHLLRRVGDGQVDVGTEGRTLRERGDVGRVGGLSHRFTLLLEGDINFPWYKHELISRNIPPG